MGPSGQSLQRSRLPLNQSVQDFPRDVEVGLTQTIHCTPKIQQPLLGACRQNAQSASEGKVPPLRLPTPTNLVDDDLIGSQFFSQQNGIALASVKAGQFGVRGSAR
jgi:hypothetical protein